LQEWCGTSGQCCSAYPLVLHGDSAMKLACPRGWRQSPARIFPLFQPEDADRTWLPSAWLTAIDWDSTLSTDSGRYLRIRQPGAGLPDSQCELCHFQGGALAEFCRVRIGRGSWPSL